MPPIDCGSFHARLVRCCAVVGLMAAAVAHAQGRRLIQIERSSEAVVLVAEATTGRIVASARASDAFVQRYHPASVFKLAIAIAALRRGAGMSSFTYECRGHDTIGGRAFDCWDRNGHGRLDLAGAIAHSCNLYFRTIADSIGIDAIARAAESLGFVGPSRFPGSCESTSSVRLTASNLLGEAFRVSVGQMLRTALVLAHRGIGEPGARPIASAMYQPLYDGLRRCVSEGTASAAWTSRFSVAGKTGTDDPERDGADVAGWFIGFAPVDHPRYAIAVLAPNSHGSDAARIAGQVLQELL